jgi:hypothetical protein
MAMTLTVDSPRNRNFPFMGSKKVRFGTGNLGTYVTSGVSIDAAALKALGLRRLDHLDLQSLTGDRIFVYDKTNQKILAYTALGTEQTQVDISAKTLRFMAIGD